MGNAHVRFLTGGRRERRRWVYDLNHERGAEAAADRSIAARLIAAQAAGALTGGLLYTRARPAGGARLTQLSAVLALGFVPLISTPPPAPMAVLMVVSGLALPPVLTVVFLLAGRPGFSALAEGSAVGNSTAPEGTAAEAFAWIATAFAVGSATGAALTGPLTTVEPRYGFAFAPVAAALAVAVMLPATRRTP